VFSFEFAALNFTSSNKNQYAYKLEGFEDNWNYIGNRRMATYTNINPGEYVFRVKASNNDRIWNETGTYIAIKITPPFWQTWWFRTLSVLAVLILIYSIYRIRVQTIKRQKEILEQQVKERTQELNERNSELSQAKKKPMIYCRMSKTDYFCWMKNAVLSLSILPPWKKYSLKAIWAGNRSSNTWRIKSARRS